MNFTTAKKLFKQQWGLISESKKGKHSSKEEALVKMGIPRKEWPLNECYACEFVHNDCFQCPINRESECCGDEGTLYYKWFASKSISERQSLAREIQRLPWKKGGWKNLSREIIL